MITHTMEVSLPSVADGRLIHVDYHARWESATMLNVEIQDCFFSEDDILFEPSTAEIEKLEEFVVRHHEEDRG